MVRVPTSNVVDCGLKLALVWSITIKLIFVATPLSTQHYISTADFPKTVGPSVLTDRNAVGPTISKYISDQMSGKTHRG
jgi:hypothetical protein